MSLCSTNYISSTIKIKNLYWIIEKLGYVEVGIEKELKTHYRKCYVWNPQNADLTYVGIELNISKNKNDKIEVETRTRAGRSSIELEHQNNTIKTINNFFGGTFETDYGRGILFDPADSSPEETSLAMALYIQRWKLKNALLPIKIYSKFMQEILKKETSAGSLYSTQIGVLPFLDLLRPCVVSSNIQLPYIIGAWENYIKNSFLAILKYSNIENKLIKPDKISADDLMKIRNGELTVEECIVNKFSFQRPYRIIDNFKKLDSSLDMNAVFVKPYKRRKTTLYDSIDKVITLRNQIVHDGFMDCTLTEKDVEKFHDEIVAASDRMYKLFAKQYSFKANFNF